MNAAHRRVARLHGRRVARFWTCVDYVATQAARMILAASLASGAAMLVARACGVPA